MVWKTAEHAKMRLNMRRRTKSTKMQTIGFRAGNKPEVVAGILMQLLVTGDEFGKPLHIPNSDVTTAFGIMKVKWQAEALLARGVSHEMV